METNNPGESQEKNPQGDQPAAGGGQTSEETEKKDGASTSGKDDASGEETVAISKKEYERLTAKHNSRGAENRLYRKKASSEDGQRFSFKERESRKPTEEEVNYAEQRELLRVQQGVNELLFESDEIAEVVKGDPTLRRILRNNPLALLDEIPVDAQDALEQLEDYLYDLSSKKVGKKAPAKKAEEKKEEPKPVPPQPKGEAQAKQPASGAKPISTLSDITKGLEDRMKEAGF